MIAAWIPASRYLLGTPPLRYDLLHRLCFPVSMYQVVRHPMMATRMTPFSIKSSRKQSLDNLDKPSPGELITIVSSMKTSYAKVTQYPPTRISWCASRSFEKVFFLSLLYVQLEQMLCYFSLLLFRFGFSSGNVALLIKKPPLWWGQLPSQLQGSSSQSEKTEWTTVTSQDVVD